MRAADHPAYAEERERLAYTLDYVAKTLDATLRKKNDLDEEIRRLDRACTDENSQTYIDLIVKTNIQSGLALKLRGLHAAKSRPYFARIDFREDGRKVAERLYIGKMCLMREGDQGLVIVDWRASVADLYYEGRLGRTSYRCPAGEIAGELCLKRQFTIGRGELREISDIDITTTDEFLGACLGANAQNRLKEIVATIQAEQNRIIRAAMGTPLLVQGAAGSGKTTIALHRIAYLIYNCGESFRPEEFMIIAPNRLFLNYISEVLPELGVERVKQTTFEDFAMKVIGERFTLRDANEKLLLLLEEEEAAPDRPRLLAEAAALKSSLCYKDLLERYIAGVEETLLPREDLRLDRWVFITKEEIGELFHREYRDWPAFKRLAMLKKYIAKRIRERKDEYVERLQAECDAHIRQIKEAMEESEVRRLFIRQTIERKEEQVRRLEEFAAAGGREYFRKLPRRGVLDYYREFLADPDRLRQLPAGAWSEEIRSYLPQYTLDNLAAGTIELEDVAPLLYLKYRLFGLDERLRLRHLVIDEAQDFGLFQLYALKKLLAESSFTILGDLAQGIHSYRGVRDWREVLREVFDGRAELLTLEQSYRTTVEIMTAANRVLARLRDPNLIPARPVLRHGEAVWVVRGADPAWIAKDMAERIREAFGGGFKSAAVIAKTAVACEAWRGRLRAEGLDAPVITGKEAEYRGGVAIVPSYLVKGLEFDLVLLPDAEEYRENELDVKLLYVAMTRALHRLCLYYQGEPSPLLEGAGADRLDGG
ncbi:MAG: RNA polymerase recycling motor HelD [Bacteroidota bacterium]